VISSGNIPVGVIVIVGGPDGTGAGVGAGVLAGGVGLVGVDVAARPEQAATVNAPIKR
jgi:hypothetical protein